MILADEKKTFTSTLFIKKIRDCLSVDNRLLNGGYNNKFTKTVIGDFHELTSGI